MSRITMRQAHAQLRNMGIFNMAESLIEEEGPATFARWKRPSEIVTPDDPIVLKLKRQFGLSDYNIQSFFNAAAKQKGGPPESGPINLGTQSGGEDMGSTAEPKWLKLARSYVGTREVPGKASNSKIDSMFKDAGYPGYKDDTAWCAAFVSAVLVRGGYPKLKNLAARSALTYGTKLSGPKVGAIVVFWRGSRNSWQGHVGFVSAINHSTKTLRVIGGNQNDSVSEATFPMSKVLGYRWPVEATIPALKAAGSTEAKTSETAKNVVVTTGVVAVAAEVAQNNPEAVQSVVPTVTEWDAVAAVMERVNEWLLVFAQNKWVAYAGVAALLYVLIKRWQSNRIERAKMGYPILKEEIEAEEAIDVRLD